MRLPLRFCAILTLGVLYVSVSGCPKDKVMRNPADELLSASKSAGVDVRGDEAFTIASGNEIFVTAPVTGWEQLPASQLKGGVNIAFAYVGTSVPNVPPGYYTLKAFADGSRLGTVDAKVQFIDREGKVAAEIPAEAEIHSLTVPAKAASLHTFVTTLTRNSSTSVNQRVIWFRCPNGECIRFPVLRPLTAVPF